MTRGATERTLAADERAQAVRHQARLLGDGRHFTVKSTSEPGVSRKVRVLCVGETVTFICDCPAGHGKPAFVPCVHGARAARRLRRENLLRWDGYGWRPTQAALTVGSRLPAVPEADDPFAGLPGC